MSAFSRDTLDMTLAEMIAELPYNGEGELHRRRLEGRSPESVLYDCCEELHALEDMIEAVSWSVLASGEGVGESFHRGRDRILDNIRFRIAVAHELIRKATSELAGRVPS